MLFRSQIYKQMKSSQFLPRPEAQFSDWTEERLDAFWDWYKINRDELEPEMQLPGVRSVDSAKRAVAKFNAKMFEDAQQNALTLELLGDFK